MGTVHVDRRACDNPASRRTFQMAASVVSPSCSLSFMCRGKQRASGAVARQGQLSRGREGGPMALFEGIGKKLDKMKDDMAFDNWAPQSARAWGKSEFWGLSKQKPGSEGIGLLTEEMLKQLQAEELAKAN